MTYGVGNGNLDDRDDVVPTSSCLYNQGLKWRLNLMKTTGTERHGPRRLGRTGDEALHQIVRTLEAPRNRDPMTQGKESLTFDPEKHRKRSAPRKRPQGRQVLPKGNRLDQGTRSSRGASNNRKAWKNWTAMTPRKDGDTLTGMRDTQQPRPGPKGKVETRNTAPRNQDSGSAKDPGTLGKPCTRAEKVTRRTERRARHSRIAKLVGA